jgi:hypothetical protein
MEKAPNTKLQISSKLQTPNFTPGRAASSHRLRHWEPLDLEFGAYLELGAWILVFLARR